MSSKLLAVCAGLTMSLTALAGCSSGNSSVTPASSSENPSTSNAELKAADSALGPIVVDQKGRTAYYFTKDTANSGKSACAGPCLQAWPPITTTSGTPSVDGISGKVGTIALTDGTKQITINGMPIYLFAKDTGPGDLKGQGVGSVWYVIAPDGKMVTKAASGY